MPSELELGLQNLTSLNLLSINATSQLRSFPEVPLPSELRSLLIIACTRIDFLPRSWMCSSNTSLETLNIIYSSFRYIAKVQLPPNLRRLIIEGCDYLTIVLDEEEVQASCSNHLEYMGNTSCPSPSSSLSKSDERSNSHPEINQPSRASIVSRDSIQGKALKYLHISGCQKLVSLATSFHHYVSLEELILTNCENLVTLPCGMNYLTSSNFSH